MAVETIVSAQSMTFTNVSKLSSLAEHNDHLWQPYQQHFDNDGQEN